MKCSPGGHWRGGRCRWGPGKGALRELAAALRAGGWVSWGQLKGKVSPGFPRALSWSTPHSCGLLAGAPLAAGLSGWQCHALGFAEFLCLAPFHELCFPFAAALLSTRLSLILHLKSRAQGQSVAFSARFLCLISCVHLGAPVSFSSSSSAGDRRALLCFMVSKE